MVVADAEDLADGAAGRVDAASLGPTLRRLLSELPADQREVLLLCALGGMTYSEIASTIGAPVGTVRSRLHRARATFRAGLINDGYTVDPIKDVP